MSDAGDASVPEPPDPPEGGRGEVQVLGTAHVSHASVDEVNDTIDREQPDVVAVELDEGRYRQMQGETPDDIEAEDLLSGNTVFQFLAYWMLSYVQSRLGEKFDIEPGADMRAAIEAAERNGKGVALVDRDIQVTIQRFWARISVLEKMKMVGGLALGVTDPRTIGISFGAALGAALGIAVAAFFAPLLGLEGALTLGLSNPTILASVGALAAGTIGGLFLGMLFLPSLESTEQYTGGLLSGFSLRLLGGVVLGVGGCLAVVATDASIGPLSADWFVGVGEFAIRAAVGVFAGLGLGALVGVVIGILLEAISGDVEEIDEFDIEQLTDTDVVTAMMEEFRRFSPRGAEALIDERDAYIAYKLHALREQGYHVVAVVGAGHKAGIDEYLAKPHTIPDIGSISETASGRRFSILKAVGYLMTFGFVAFFLLLVMAGVRDEFLLRLFGAWFIVNGVFAFTLARLAGARLESAGVGGAVAWLTSINPLIAPGWFAGYVELKHRPVNVTDIGRLNEIVDDTERPLEQAMRDMFDVPLFRLIMIVAFTNVGSMIASYLFLFAVLPWLAGPEFGGIDALGNELLRGARNSLELLRGVVGL